MTKKTALLTVTVGLLVLVASATWADPILCRGVVRNTLGQPIADAYVQGCNNVDCNLSTTSGPHGTYALTRATEPPAGTYYYCAKKSGVGKDGTSIYHTYQQPDSWDPSLSGTDYTCPACFSGK